MSAKERLKELQLKVGSVGAEKLYLEGKKQKVPGITKDAVKLYLATCESKQLFKPLPESKGKSAAEAKQFRAQMDLIDIKYSPSRFKGKGPQFKYAIVLIDVMSRYLWSAPFVNKEPESMEPVLRRLLNSTDENLHSFRTEKGTTLLDK